MQSDMHNLYRGIIARTYLYFNEQYKMKLSSQELQKYKATGWKRLDHDKDGEACECLQGGSGYNKSTCTRWRKKNGK